MNATYICHCMFLCDIRACFLLIWPPNHEVEYVIRMYLLTQYFFFKLSFFWELKYFLPSINLKSNEWSFFKTYPCAIFQKIGKDERSKAFVIAEDLLDRTDVGNSRSWIIYALWRGKKEWRIQREQVQKRIYSKFLRSGGKKLLRLKFSCQHVTEEGSKKHHSVINHNSYRILTGGA